MTYSAQSKLALIGGYTGQGVSTSNVAGKLLAALICDQATELKMLPIAQHHSRKWIPEPLRWLVVRYMQQALLRIDESTEAGKAKPLDSFIAEFLGRH